MKWELLEKRGSNLVFVSPKKLITIYKINMDSETIMSSRWKAIIKANGEIYLYDKENNPFIKINNINEIIDLLSSLKESIKFYFKEKSDESM